MTGGIGPDPRGRPATWMRVLEAAAWRPAWWYRLNPWVRQAVAAVVFFLLGYYWRRVFAAAKLYLTGMSGR